MQDFLTYLGINDFDRFDLSFDYIGKDALDPTIFNLSIRKETPWNSQQLSEFKLGLENINWKYNLRFAYEKEPSLNDIQSLFESWTFEEYRTICHGKIKVTNHLLTIDGDDNTSRLFRKFLDYLKWLCYPSYFEEDTLDIPLPKKEKEVVSIAKKKTEAVHTVEVNEVKKEESSNELTDIEKSLLAQAEQEAALEREEQQKKRFRRKKAGDFTSLLTIKEVENYPTGSGVQVIGKIFNFESKNTRKGRLMATFGVGDEYYAVNVVLFEGKELPIELLNQLKDNLRIRLKGTLELDYSGEKQIMGQGLEILPDEEMRADPYPEKRVELHLHTKMSQMDGVGDILDYCKLAKNMGMKALAVTDHGVIQDFPEAEAAKKKTGIKILYGCEFYMFDNPVYCYRPNDKSIRDSKYCVFDFETTGLSSKYDRPTEFAGVIFQNGMITDRLTLFINPERPIPEKIVQKTRITNEMVKDAPTPKEAIGTILKFIGDATLVSHNATFDEGFLNLMTEEAGLPKVTNPIIDTLALSHYFFPDAKRHTLEHLSVNLKLQIYDAGSAHRADYDSEVLCQVWEKMINLFTQKNPKMTLRDLEELKDHSPLMFKHLKGYHLIALAKNQQGLKDLYRLISHSHVKYLSGGSQPKIPRDEIIKYRENLLIGSACFNGEVFEDASHRRDDIIQETMKFYDYIEIQPPENYSYLVNIGDLSQETLLDILHNIVRLADLNHQPVVATGDCHYVNPEDKIARDIYIFSKGIGGLIHPLKRRPKDVPPFDNPDQHFRSTQEMMDIFTPLFGEDKAKEIVISNTNMIADQISDVQILKNKLYAPTPNLPGSDEKLRTLCYKNLHKMYGENPDPLIVERLEKELNGIISNGYSVTYYIAYLIVKKAHEDGYIVGSRGSVGSSLTALMAEVSEVNPLPPHYLCPKCHHLEWNTDDSIRSGFDLPEKRCPICGEIMIRDGQDIPFETFLGFNAEKVPDIDLNFPKDYQSKAHAYARVLLSTPEENEKIKKGEPLENPHVIRAGTIGTTETKNAIGYVRHYYEEINEDWSKVSRAYISYLASKCVGVKRTTGQHPGGIVVIPSDMDIFDFTPYQHPADDPDADWLTTHFGFDTMHDSVLKLDLLGHKDPMALRNMSLLTGVDLKDIPMNDPKVISLFNSYKALNLNSNPLGFKTGAIALPEFGTDFVQRILEETKPNSFNELLVISGLSHGTEVWANNAQDLIENATCSLKDVIGCRDDIMNYLIRMGLPNKHAFTIMESVRHGKGLKEEDEKAMREHNIPEWYINSCNHIRYLFPRSHATAYVMGAVRGAYFKLYYPLEFYATYFTVRCAKFDLLPMVKGLDAIVARIRELEKKRDEKRDFKDTDDDVLRSLIVASELADRGYKIENISLERSSASEWLVDKENNAIIPPFSVLDGLGEAAAQTVVDARKDGPFLSKEDLYERTKLSEKDIKSLTDIGALDGLGATNQMSLFDFF